MINEIVHSPSVAVNLQPKIQLPAQYDHRTPCLAEKQEAYISCGSKFTVITTASGLIGASLYLNRDDWWKTALDKTEKFKRISQPIFVAGNPGYQNYYHWTYQIWNSILFAKSINKGSARIDVLGPTLNSWRRRYIELLGPEINYIEARPDCAYFLDQAWWSDLMWGRYAFNPSHKALEILEEFGEKFCEETPSRIYISRKDTPRRGVENEDEVEKMLIDRGFTSVLLSTLPLTQQIALFRGAEFIVAPHGAGLTNIVFCGRNKKLIELLPEDYVNQCFRVIASAKDFDYTGIINSSTADARGYHFSKISIDISSLGFALDEMDSRQ